MIHYDSNGVRFYVKSRDLHFKSEHLECCKNNNNFLFYLTF